MISEYTRKMSVKEQIAYDLGFAEAISLAKAIIPDIDYDTLIFALRDRFHEHKTGGKRQTMADCVSNAAEQVEELRYFSENRFDCDYKCLIAAVDKAAYAIEQLFSENARLKATAIHWHKITSRPLTDEEKEWYAEQGYEPWEMPEFIYDCEMPEDGQEILIATPWGTDKDTCSNDAEYGIGLEFHDDFDNVYAWAELPKYEEEEET